MNTFDTVHFIYLSGGTTTKSDFAREYATQIAEAASSGLITTETPMDGFGNVWRVTPDGLMSLFAQSIEGEFVVLETQTTN